MDGYIYTPVSYNCCELVTYVKHVASEKYNLKRIAVKFFIIKVFSFLLQKIDVVVK